MSRPATSGPPSLNTRVTPRSASALSDWPRSTWPSGSRPYPFDDNAAVGEARGRVFRRFTAGRSASVGKWPAPRASREPAGSRRWVSSTTRQGFR